MIYDKACKKSHMHITCESDMDFFINYRQTYPQCAHLKSNFLNSYHHFKLNRNIYMCRNSDVLDYANCTSLNMPMIALRVSETHGVSLPTFRTIEHHDQ